MATHLHAFGDDALGDLDAVGLVEALHAGRVSVPEVVEAAIARAEKVTEALNPVAFRAYDRARTEALGPRPGFFAGVPTFVKDTADVAGMPTQLGADAWDPVPVEHDGDFARMFLATGLVPLGKTQMSEYGWSPSAEHARLGPVRSPWDTDRTAGGSSSGSAALVAAGAVPLAHAADGGGSIRIPASVNGLVGLKPTRGRLAQDKYVREMPVRIVSDGVLTRTVRDTAAFFREAEKVYRPLHLAPIGDLTRPGRRRLRVGLNTTGLGGRGADAQTTALTEDVARLLEDLGHTVVEVDPPVPATFRDDFLLYWSLLALAVLTTGRVQHGRSWRRDRHDNFTLGLARYASRRLHQVPMAIARLRRVAGREELFYEKYDVSLTPVVASETPKIGHLDPTLPFESLLDRLEDWVAFTPWHNVTGAPAVSVPLATTANGLPQGMMFGAAPGHEAALIELAYELEEARPFARIQD